MATTPNAVYRTEVSETSGDRIYLWKVTTNGLILLTMQIPLWILNLHPWTIRSATAGGLIGIALFPLFLAAFMSVRNVTVVDAGRSQITKQDSIFGVRLGRPKVTVFKDFQEVVIYDSRRRGFAFDDPAGRIGEKGQPKLAIGLKFPEYGGYVEKLISGFDNKKLFEEAQAIAALVGKPLVLANWLKVIDVELPAP